MTGLLAPLPEAILWPVAVHLTVVLALFCMLSITRMGAIRRGEVPGGANAFARKGTEPEASRRYAATLNNQFELPIFFHALVALLFAADAVTGVQVALAWAFAIGRVAHALVQTQSDVVPLRGAVFGINFLALIAMWIIFLLPRLFPALGWL